MFQSFAYATSGRQSTLKRVYHLIHSSGPVSRSALLEKTGLTQSTLTRNIDELLSMGFIREHGYGNSSGGRPPALYQVVADCGYIIGIDLSRTTTKIMLFNLMFEVVDKHTFVMTPQHTPNLVIEEIVTTIKSFMNKYQFDIESLLGIGIGAVGPLDREQGVILQPEGFTAPGWENVPIVHQIVQSFPSLVQLDNGANYAALGEYHHTPVKPQNMMYCISGVGLRCGVLINGQIFNQHPGDVSDYGHIVIDLNGRKCSCGKRGCLTAYISEQSIVSAITREMKSIFPDIPVENSNYHSLDQIIRAVNDNDPLVRKIVMESAVYLGVGLANMVNILHLESIVLDGPLFSQIPQYYEQVIKSVREQITFRKKESLHFSQGQLKSAAVATGAAIEIFTSLFPFSNET